MAVENCTISTVSITALGGSTLVAGTKTLIITPDADFYVSASMCSIGNAMETFDGSNIYNTIGANVTTGITQVQFVDVGDGTVEAIITHGAISISSSTEDFFIDIDVTASPPRVFSCIKISTSHNVDGSDSAMSTSTHLDVANMSETQIENTSTSHQVYSSGEVSSAVGQSTYMGTMRFTAAAGKRFPPQADGLPCILIYSGPMLANPEYWEVTVTNYTYSGVYITGFDVNINYVTPSVSPEGIEDAGDFCDLGHVLSIRTKPNTIPVAVARSYSVNNFVAEPLFGYDAQVRDVRVFGTPGSRFEVGVVNESGEVYDFKTGTFSKTLNRNKINYHEIPSSGIFRAAVNYPSSLSAAKSYNYFVEGVATPAKVSVGGEAGASKNLIEASTTSLSSIVPTKGSLASLSQKSRQRVQLKVTQSASEHTIPSASSTGVSLFGIANEVSPKKINIPDPDIPYSPVAESLYKVDFSFTCTLGTSGGGKAYRSSGLNLSKSTLRYVYDANTITAPEYYITNGTITSDYSDGSSIVFAGSFYVSKFGEVDNDGLYCLEIYLDNFIEIV